MADKSIIILNFIENSSKMKSINKPIIVKKSADLSQSTE